MLNHNDSQIRQNEKRLKRNPDSKEVHLNLGVLYFKDKKYDKALEHLTEAGEHLGNDLTIRKMLGVVHFSTHNYDQAEDIFLQILQEESDNIEAYHYLSKICVMQNDLDRALQFLRKASEIDPFNSELLTELGTLSYSINNTEDAENYLKKAIESDEKYRPAYTNLIDIYLQQDRIKEAKDISITYRKIFPEDHAGIKYHGIICRLDGTFHEAIRYLLLAQEGIKEDIEIPYNLGLSFMSTGDFECAIDYFKESLEINPDHIPAKEKLVSCYFKLAGANNALRLFKEETDGVHCTGTRKERLSIIVPAFNEAENILTNTKEIKKSVSALGCEFEIVVVDDGSEDDTYEILELLSRTVKEVRPHKSKTNKGKGIALREASLKASGDFIIFLDADLELHPKLIPDLIQRMKNTGADVVLGSKRHPESKLYYPWHRKLISNAYYLVNRLLFGIPIKDTQTGIKVFKKEVLDRVIPKLIEKQYAFDLELIVNVHALGYKIIEAPITLNYSRKLGRIGSRVIIRTAIDTLAIFYRMKILNYYNRRQLPLLEYPKVSIVIPFKEFGQYAQQCLEYCLRLDYPDFEVLLLPDQPIDFFGLSQVRVIPTGPKPPSEKRDIGVKEASGEVVAFLDHDAYPGPEWLRNVARNFTDKGVAAVGGPGMTPEEDTFWQKLSGAIFSSRFVSGSYTYRYTPKTFQEVEDFPSCNLSIRKRDFEKIGGFDTRYWPGEDTILCLKIIKELKKKIVYDPDAGVYHHRRELFGPHLRQVKSYALHRGFFVKKFPETSRKPQYFLPSLFVLTVVFGLGLAILNPVIRFGYMGCMCLYLLLVSLPQLLTFSPRRIVLGTAGVFLTHTTYGIYFIKGLFSRKLIK